MTVGRQCFVIRLKSDDGGRIGIRQPGRKRRVRFLRDPRVARSVTLLRLARANQSVNARADWIREPLTQERPYPV